MTVDQSTHRLHESCILACLAEQLVSCSFALLVRLTSTALPPPLQAREDTAPPVAAAAAAPFKKTSSGRLNERISHEADAGIRCRCTGKRRHKDVKDSQETQTREGG